MGPSNCSISWTSFLSSLASVFHRSPFAALALFVGSYSVEVSVILQMLIFASLLPLI